MNLTDNTERPDYELWKEVNNTLPNRFDKSDIELVVALITAREQKARMDENSIILEFPPNTLTEFKGAIRARKRYLLNQTPLVEKGMV